MNIIKIEQFENGGHSNQFNAQYCPQGWAIIPQSIAIPSSFPFVDIEVSGNTVTSMTERDVPEVEPIEPIPTVEDRVAELEKENKRLKAQATLMDEQFEFLSDCLIEMADVVYAE